MKQNIAPPANSYFHKHCFLLCVAMSLLCFSTTAQFAVTIQLKNVPIAHNRDEIFVAGNFNDWNPAENNCKFLKNGDTYFLKLTGLKANTYQFKFTRGSWGKVECTAKGADVENHSLKFSSDTTVEYDIAGWIDDFGPVSKIHTASKNVQILDTAFYIPQLKKYRRIWIYLPENYSSNKKHYPVMYLQDGQNIFDEYTSAYGEWSVDECLDSLIKIGKQGCIVVGIDNGGETRMNEYNPYEFVWKDSTTSKIFLPQGDAYVSFLIQTLKPYIDKNYRTLPSKENTIIAGSSMGGLISYYAALKYPDAFGKAGIFSPAFWTADGILQLTDSLDNTVKGKFFFYMGGKEGDSDVDAMIRIQEKIGKNSTAMIYSFIDPNGQHNEAAWRKWFAEFYNWIIADGYNVITKGDD